MPNSTSTETAATYRVVHTTRYTYSEAVSVSHHLARVKPRVFAGQECLSHELQIEPPPAVVRSHQDYFGNTVAFFIVERAHSELTVQSVSTVKVEGRVRPASAATPPWEEAREYDALPLEALECLFDSTSIAASDAVRGFAHPSFPPCRPLLEAVEDVMRRIHADFTFDPKATTITTPLRDVLQLRRGVCQDFARLAIACLRSQGLAARYVSGYLETVPPPGAPRLAGVDASHAWLAVYCPGHGWIDIDPTNNMFPSTTHVTLAWGRDYADVSPVRGVILGGGQHTLHVSVDVLRNTESSPQPTS
jgi:transglutaminase-like putative cysteine protease